jgi:hypothetical protein
MAKNPFFSWNVNFFFLGMLTFHFFSIESNLFFYFESKIRFVSFWFRFFLDIFDRNGFYFPFDHNDVRIKPNVSFRYRNKLKIRSQKRIGFMLVDITNKEWKLIPEELNIQRKGVKTYS